MQRRLTKKTLLISGVLMLLVPPAMQGDEVATTSTVDTTTVELTVLGPGDVAVSDATVTVKKGSSFEEEFTTDDQGKVTLEGIPRDKVKIIVIKSGFETYNREHRLSRQNAPITIRLEETTSTVDTTTSQLTALGPGDVRIVRIVLTR